MKEYLITALALATTLLIVTNCNLLLAQEEENLEFSWGATKSISANQIVVTEIDPVTEKEVSATYIIDANTKFQNVDSAKNIKAGEEVEIDFEVKDGKRVAKTIFVEKPESFSEEDFSEEDIDY